MKRTGTQDYQSIIVNTSPRRKHLKALSQGPHYTVFG